MPVLDTHGDRLNASLALTLLPVSAGAALCAAGMAPVALVAALFVLSLAAGCWGLMSVAHLRREMAATAARLQSVETAGHSPERAPEGAPLTGELATVGHALDGLRARLAAASEDTERNGRIKAALEAVTSSVMIADAENRIVFMNKSVEAMLLAAEADLRKALPDFETRKVLGSNMDIFHKNPAHQKGMLAAMRTTHRTQITVGGRIFSLVATPVLDQAGRRAGTVVEWGDRTAEVGTEREIDRVVQAASAGDFGTRLELEGKEGFFKTLAVNVNQLLETSEQGLNEVAALLEAFSEGNLSHRIERDYEGLFGKVKACGNATAEQLTRVLGEVTAAADALTGAANQVSATAQSLAQSASEQASSVEQTTESINAMSASINQNTDNAKVTDGMATQASTPPHFR